MVDVEREPLKLVGTLEGLVGSIALAIEAMQLGRECVAIGCASQGIKTLTDLMMPGH